MIPDHNAGPYQLRDWGKRDPRIRLVENPVRLGLPRSADRVVRESRASVCARMDAAPVPAERLQHLFRDAAGWTD